MAFPRNLQYAKFSAYGFLKNLRFFDAFLILFFLEKGMSYTQIALLYTTREILTNVLEIPSGLIADALGRRTSMIFSFLSYIVSFGIFYTTASVHLFFLAMIAFAAGDAFRSGTHKAMIFTYLRLNNLESEKSVYYGHTRSWSKFGSAISSIAAGFLVLWQGSYQSVFIFSVIPYILDLLLIVSYPKELDGDRDETIQLADFGSKFGELGKDILVSLRNFATVRAVIDSSLFTGFMSGIKDYLQPLLRTLAISTALLSAYSDDSRAAVFIGLWYGGINVLSAFMSRLSGRFAGANGQRLLAITLLSGGAVAFFAGYFDNSSLPLASSILFSFLYLLENLRKPAAISIVSDRIAPDIQASVLSVEAQAKTLFAGIFSLVIGVSADYFGLSMAIMITSALMVIMWLGFHLIRGLCSAKSSS